MADQAYEPRLKTDYRQRIRGAMKEQFSYTNEMQIPRLDKIVLNMGIGEAVMKGMKGDIKAELGIGELKIEGAAADYGSVSGAVGVGDLTLRTKGGSREESRVLVSKESKWAGSGAAKIEAEVGVGEAVVRLE